MLQDMQSSTSSCTCNFNCCDIILIITMTPNWMFGNWCLYVPQKGLSDQRQYLLVSSGVHRQVLGVPQLGKATVTVIQIYNIWISEYHLHFLFLYNCLSDMLSIWSWFAFLFSFAMQSCFFFFHLWNQQHLILLPSLSQYELFAFPQALVTF